MFNKTPATDTVKVHFYQGLAGFDAGALDLAEKYARVRKEMTQTYDTASRPSKRVYTDRQIDERIAEMRATDDACLRVFTGPRTRHTRDWSFAAGKEYTIAREIAEAWQRANICSIIESGRECPTCKAELPPNSR